ncbi:MAG: PilZ domain-containing protein [Candidatus Omnitrophota bacterium]
MGKKYAGAERRKFVRLDYVTPVNCKICKKKTLSMLFEGYTVNVSETGVLCTVKGRVKKDDMLWLSFDRTTLHICEDLEQRVLIYQNGVVGKVVRVEPKRNDSYSVGIRFVTREEKNLTNIFPKVYFFDKKN